MKDIDFDELDKAVNSLMGTVASIEDEDTPKEKTFTVSSTLKPGEKPSYQKIEAAAMRIGSETLIGQGERTTVEDLDVSPIEKSELSTATELPVDTEVVTAEVPLSPVQPAPQGPSAEVIAAARRPASGRFMDVVHPSSDMRTAAPLPRLVVPERSSLEREEAITPVEEEPVQLPDPVEPQFEETQPQPAAEPIITPVESEAEPSAFIDPTPLTPFLPDAKVEKRPLGDPSAMLSSGEELEVLTDNNEAVNNAQTVTNGVVEEPGYEMGDDNQLPLNASDFNHKQTDAEKQLRDIEDGVQPELQKDTEEPSAEASVRAVESGDTENLSKAAQSGIIVNPVDETNPNNPDTDIFDVKEYHQPLDHPAKQKSGWGTVIIIVAIILICASIGAATYFVLGMGMVSV